MAYIMLALVGLGLAFYCARTEERPHLLVAQLVVYAAVIMLADWIFFGWFQLYNYRPHLTRDPLQDAVLGEVLAEMFFIPGLAAFLDRWAPGASGAAAGAAIATGLEYAFLQIGVSTQHGWSLWYTAGAFVIYFGGMHRFWQAVRQGSVPEGWVTALVRACALFDAVANLTLYLMFMGHVKLNLAILPSQEGNQALGRFLAYAPSMFLLGYWVCAATGTARLWRLAAAVAAFAGLNILLTITGFLVFEPPWGVAIDAVARGAAILAATLLVDWINPPTLAAGARRYAR